MKYKPTDPHMGAWIKGSGAELIAMNVRNGVHCIIQDLSEENLRDGEFVSNEIKTLITEICEFQEIPCECIRLTGYCLFTNLLHQGFYIPYNFHIIVDTRGFRESLPKEGEVDMYGLGTVHYFC